MIYHQGKNHCCASAVSAAKFCIQFGALGVLWLLGKQLGSGERNSLLTRHAAFEPLPASVRPWWLYFISISGNGSDYGKLTKEIASVGRPAAVANSF
jgi:hypothetical protein